MIHSDFAVGLAEPNYIIIVDMNWGGKSVTNDIEYVIQEIWKIQEKFQNCPVDGWMNTQLIIYSDTMEDWDGVEQHNGKFIRFVPFGGKTKEEAIEKYNALTGASDQKVIQVFPEKEMQIVAMYFGSTVTDRIGWLPMELK